MVQETLQRPDGVAKATVDFAEGRAEIVVDDTFVLAPARLRKAVRDRGYGTGKIDVMGTGQILDGQDGLVIRFENRADIPLEPNHLTEELATGPQPVRILLRVVEEAEDRFKLEVIQVIEEK